MCALEREGSTLCVKERERETEGTNAVFVTIFGKSSALNLSLVLCTNFNFLH